MWHLRIAESSGPLASKLLPHLYRRRGATVRALKAPASGVVVYADDAFAGFGVRVSQAGTKSFVLTYGPRRERQTIGRVGIISLQDARAEAKRRLAEYTLGRGKPKTLPWQAAVDAYLGEVKRECKPSTHEFYRYVLNRHFKYGQTKLTDLAPHDIQKSLGRLTETPAEEQRAFVIARAFLNWAHRQHYTRHSARTPISNSASNGRRLEPLWRAAFCLTLPWASCFPILPNSLRAMS